jgi:hypothetical protein
VSAAVAQTRSRDCSVVGSISHSETIRSKIGALSESTVGCAGSPAGLDGGGLGEAGTSCEGGASGVDRGLKYANAFDVWRACSTAAADSAAGSPS